MELQAILADSLIYYFIYIFSTGNYMKPMSILLKNFIQSDILEDLSSIKCICAFKGLEVKSREVWHLSYLVLAHICLL